MQKKIAVKLTIANILNGATRGLAVTAISGYQKFLSPHKGFSCAHRVLYGCESCSQYFKRVIAEEGIGQAIANAKGRFQECREANQILKARRAKCRAIRKYYASRLVSHNSNIMAIESGESGNPENMPEPEIPDIDQDLGDLEQDLENSDTQTIGGSQWEQKRRSQANQQNNQTDGGSNNNCNDCADCADCADGLNAIPSDCISSDRTCDNPLDGANCPDLSCPDLNCGNADCLSGMDCSGLDCSGLDCSGLDCGGLDCGGCG